jgi:hypothetical protein
MCRDFLDLSHTFKFSLPYLFPQLTANQPATLWPLQCLHRPPEVINLKAQSRRSENRFLVLHTFEDARLHFSLILLPVPSMDSKSTNNALAAAVALSLSSWRRTISSRYPTAEGQDLKVSSKSLCRFADPFVREINAVVWLKKTNETHIFRS